MGRVDREGGKRTGILLIITLFREVSGGLNEVKHLKHKAYSRDIFMWAQNSR